MDITIDTVKLFGELTRGRFDVWMLAGDARRFDRVRLMASLLGVSKVPIAKCGVYAISSELANRMRPDGECAAARDSDLASKCRAMLADPAMI